jgi:flagellar motor switch protein FliN
MTAQANNFGDSERIEVLMNVPLRLTAELGSAKMSVSEILSLGTGSIVELDRAANHPIDLLVNGRPIAKGEIVAVDDTFGLRIVELLVP